MSKKGFDKKVTAWAPATVANVGVGFDLLGFAIAGIGDTVTVKRTLDRAVKITNIDTTSDLPFAADKNTATAGLIKLQKDLNLPFGFSVEIKKGIPKGSGMGGSASSAVAAILAANALLKRPLKREALLPYAIEGEFVASGSRHADNVAPGLLGGFVLVQSDGEVLKLPVPRDLRVVLLYPGFELETKKAREILPAHITLKEHIHASALLAGFLVGCFSKNHKLIKKNLKDILIEPYREKLVPGFREIKTTAEENGAWGAAMAGAGPSLFVWCAAKSAKKLAQKLLASAISQGHENSKVWISAINSHGARIVK